MVNPLNCAATAARRVLAPASAITVERTVAELDRIADVRRDIVGAVIVLLLD